VYYPANSIFKINYNGTVSNWESIKKDVDKLTGASWDCGLNTEPYAIYCTDGEIAKNGTITYYK
jgi:hypothetical protein